MLHFSSKKETIVIIPARGGSKGIPRKNLQVIGAYPLIAYSILVARASKLVSRVVVSTDDKEIADTARAYGAEVPFIRPASISGDNANIGDAVQHMLAALRECENYDPDIVAEMYPTHPFRTPELIDHLLSQMEQGYRLLRTVHPIHLVRHTWCTINSDGTICKKNFKNGGHKSIAMRTYGIFFARSTRRVPRGTYIHTLKNPEQLIDIDDPQDLALARSLVDNGYYRLPIPKDKSKFK